MERKSSNFKLLWIALSVMLFSFFTGYYFCYRINEKDKSKLEIIQHIMENEWYYGIDEENLSGSLETKMILGILDSDKDPHTKYLTSLGSLSERFIGVGINVNIYGDYFIVNEINGEHAFKADIRIGDILTKVNGIDIKNKTFEEVNALMTSYEGKIALTVKRGEVTLTILAPILEYTPITVFTEEYGNVSYVKISEFNKDTSASLDSYFNKLSSDHTNLILDLRGNPGGYISAVRDVADLFLPRNKIVMTTVDKHGNNEVIKTQDNNMYLFNKMVVLIDEDSASGAEALAAALDYHLDDIVTLYGNTTYGKGSAQTTYTFKDGTHFHYTYALWYTPGGYTINKIGVKPEITIQNNGMSSLKFSGVTVKLHDYGEDVLYIQKFLDKLGYETPLHSFFDEEMAYALVEYQTDYNLTITGEADNETIRHMVKLMYDDKVKYQNEEFNLVLRSMF